MARKILSSSPINFRSSAFQSPAKLRFIVLLLIISLVAIFYINSTMSSLSLPPPRIVQTIMKSPTLIYQVIEMDDRQPVYKLATLNGQRPYADGDRAQGTVVQHLQLVDKCREDPSLIVVDVGAYIGDFGLYAAACGCQVYMFEVQPNMVDLIETSISVNNFTSSRVHIINKAVSDLPSNSQLTFSIAGGDTTAKNGSLNATTIRLDDFPWPKQSKILLLKIDVEGFELNVLRSAEKLFQDKRIDHLISEYTAYWTDRSAQKDLLSYIENQLHPKKFYALHRTEYDVYGPLDRLMLEQFYENHFRRHLQTDIYVTFVETTIKSKSYYPRSSFA